MTHQVTRIDAETVEYRGISVVRDDRKKGYWNHYSTSRSVGITAPTLKEVKLKIDQRLLVTDMGS